MEVRADWARLTRGIQDMFSGLVAAIGSTRTPRSKRRAKPRNIQLVSWAGRANTDSWFLAQLEQSKNRALIYYAKNQVR